MAKYATCFNLLQLANSVVVCAGLLMTNESFLGLLPIFEPNGHEAGSDFDANDISPNLCALKQTQQTTS